ncbi:PAS domain-containing sensor histidine kinase [Cytophagaceae bacterium ABcell3]|nr:PAS domain-containing sensor histidine kinase [Cytophagaceae bacterium ABcell3]
MPHFASALYKDLYKGMLENLPDAVIVVNQQGIIRAANKQAGELFGYSVNELENSELDILIPKPSKEIHKKYVEQYFESPARRRMGNHRVVKALRKDGSEFYIDIILAPLKVEDAVYSVASCRDIDAQKGQEEILFEDNLKLQTINKELEKFSYTISHDLKAPLAKVQGLMDMLLEDVEKGKSAKELQQVSQYISESLSSMKNMISDVLDTAKNRPSEESVHIREVLEELYRLIIVPHNFKLVLDCNFAVVSGGKVQLLQVLLNLITNAIKYNDKESGEIELTCHSKDGMYEFCVSDNGKGISEERLEKIFEKFEKGQEEDSDSHGIGLATVKEIVESRGGKVYAESKGGKGTQVKFSWPKAK